jgi:hypothetical protein
MVKKADEATARERVRRADLPEAEVEVRVSDEEYGTAVEWARELASAAGDSAATIAAAMVWILAAEKAARESALERGEAYGRLAAEEVRAAGGRVAVYPPEDV